VAVRLPVLNSPVLRSPPGICSRTSGTEPFAVVSPPTYVQMSVTHTKQKMQVLYQCISVYRSGTEDRVLQLFRGSYN
jgi:hypothetical protein